MSEENSAGAASGFPLRQKLIATSLHFLISVVAVGSLLLLTTSVWYPDFLFQTDGGWQGLRIVVLVDLVLGPLLTFVVYKRGKKGLLLDLSLIAVLQLAALLGGGYLVYAERPLALVFHEGRFYSITSDDYLDVGVPVPDMRGLDQRRPPRVALVPPTDPIAQSSVRTAYIKRQQFLYTHVPWMRDLDDHMAQVLAAGASEADLRSRPGGQALDAWFIEQGLNQGDVVFLPYSSRFRLIYLALDTTSGEVVAVLDINSEVRE